MSHASCDVIYMTEIKYEAKQEACIDPTLTLSGRAADSAPSDSYAIIIVVYNMSRPMIVEDINLIRKS